MSATHGSAVFLSYASQDADAAKRICESLRARGVAVWFDVEGGLETGDEWDQKIRRQIKECVLFIAVISQNTQARHEGYFRIEWDFAAERARGIASGIAFILPVVIDDTREPDALVPDRFRSVQWTRLPQGEMAPDVLARFVKLWSHRAGLAKHAESVDRNSAAPLAREVAPAPVATPSPEPAPAARTWLKVVVPVAGMILGLVYAFRPPAWRDRPEKPAPTVATPNAAVPAAAFPRDPELRRVRALLFAMDTIPEDFRLADDILQPVLEKGPNDPETATVAAELTLEILVRGFDPSLAARARAQRQTERAVQLAPDSPYALGALSRYLVYAGTQGTRAEELIRRAIALKPDEPRFHRTLHYVLFSAGRMAEADAQGERMAAQFPRDPLVLYDIARRYKDANDVGPMEKWMDRTLALEPPVAFALIWKAWLAAWVHGDLAAMKQFIDRVPDRQRNNTRVVNALYVHALFSGETQAAWGALNELTEEWLTDFDFTGPKALLVGNLALLDGRPDLAKVQLQAALAAAVAETEKRPNDLRPQRAQLWALIGLGRLDEARAIQRVLIQSLTRPYPIGLDRATWTSPLIGCLLLGFRTEALSLLRDSNQEADCRRVLRNMFKLDPRLKPWRGDAEIIALLAEPAPAGRGKTEGGTAAPSAPTAAKELSEGAQLAARALTLFTKTGFNRDDLGPAEDLARRATEKDPDNAATWGVRAGVQSAWIFRNWDRSESRRRETQTLANKALALDPKEPEALLALGHLLRAQGAGPQSETHLRQAVASHPDHIRLARALGFTLFLNGKNDESRAALSTLAQRAPQDPLVHYELAMSYADFRAGGANPDNLAHALDQLDAALAIQPFSSALIMKAILIGGWRGDLPEMRAALDRVDTLSLTERSEDRTVCVSMWAGLIERAPTRVEAAAALTTRPYIDDDMMPLRPKAWSLALAHGLAGKSNLARRDWQAAETALRQRIQDDPANTIYQVELAATLAWLEQPDEAARLVGAVEPVWREEFAPGRAPLLARYYAAAGDVANTVSYLRRVVDSTVFTSRHALALDPWWDKVRGAPEFAALLAPAKQ